MDRKALLASLCLLAIPACKTQIHANIFTTDVASAARDNAQIDAVATLSLEASSEEKCAEAKDAMADALSKGFSSVEFTACRQDKFDTWADFRVAVPVRQAQTEADAALMIWAAELEPGVIGATLRPNQSKIDAVIAALPSDMRNLVTGPMDTAISVTVQNDLGKDTAITMQGAFIDGEPYQLPHDSSVPHRGELKITLSDVGNAAIHKGGSLLFYMKTP